MIPEKLFPVSFVSKDNNGDLNGGCFWILILWEELMRGIYENKQIYLSSDVLNLQGKLFGVGKKSQFLSNFFVY